MLFLRKRICEPLGPVFLDLDRTYLNHSMDLHKPIYPGGLIYLHAAARCHKSLPRLANKYIKS